VANKIAEFDKYDSLVGRERLFFVGRLPTSGAQRMPSRKDGTRMGDEGKAVG